MIDRAVLIAHYDKPLDWINEIQGAEVYIYTSNPSFPQYRQVKNRGNDASHYLTFILDYYDNLPERAVFCHDHKNDWTQEYPLPEIINNLNWEAAGYFSIGARCNYWTALPFPSKKYHTDAMERNWHILDPLPYPERLTYFAGTQFCVHRDLILMHPKSFYEKCRDWVYTVDEASWFIGRFFEYTWHYIFTGDPIEKDIKYRL